MPRKSNKTSYVMNLITNGEEEQGQEGQSGQEPQNGQGVQAAQSGQDAQAAAPNNAQAAQTVVPGAAPEAETKKVVVVDEDQESERLSEEIRGQLELQLEAELKEHAGEAEMPGEEEQLQPSQEPGQIPLDGETAKQELTNIDITEPIMDTEMNTATETMDTASEAVEAAENANADMAAATENTNADMAAMAENMNADMAAATENAAAAEILNTTTQPTQPSQPGYRMVNVMETLVARVNLDKYIKEYGVCPCPRCRADVHALILTSLPSKYVVMDENAISLMLNFYESRRKTDIFTATLKACLEVKEHPRHDGEAGK